ncbi:MAG: tRNA pseudouridine(55) synthase TruB [Candidatus Neomarinimicrobiota bacterium]|nr:tRNA pseudouridine(55) synthase TruB [Candidatus Neomarinimicrobiota bacterium]MED5266057.1 tRNA pseudouridine(55) synthase TruB [Candidatus Neomarinimicrobiota bacterium]|tara:strand:- start:321 stop:953 length:633 start_codon:yes stop_codon:yes gene_type:complete
MIININKPAGWTSFDVVKKIRGIIKEKKVGHAGTLDPFATGVLILGTGSDTKKLSDISSSNKTYIADLTLGKETDTYDCDGKIVSKAKIPKLDRKEIDKVVSSFKGINEQIPPMYSAKKIDGVRLYKLARQNKVVNRNPIKIKIDDIQVIRFKSSTISFQVTCSKGTYIRVLGVDIARKLGTVGYLSSLKRISVGSYNIADSKLIEEITI